jgi:carboxymethylenebutenolidase
MIRMMAVSAALILGMSVAKGMEGGQGASPPLLTPEQRQQRYQQLDAILGAEVPLGSDAWHELKLDQSPRHHEIARIPGGARTLQAFVVYPAVKTPATVVVMIPEDQGLNNWARDMADQIAAMGYIVIVPDVLAGYGPKGGGRADFPDTRSAMMVLGTLTSVEKSMTADFNAWADYGKKLPQANGKLAVVGFAWGAGRAFWFATQRKDLNAAFIFYDWAPPAEALADVTAPVYGFYAENDTRVEKTLESTKATMASLGKKYEQVIYPGADHMFVRLGDEPGNTNPANIEARSRSLARLQELLKGL